MDFFVSLGPSQFQSSHLGLAGHGIQFSTDDLGARVLVLDETSEKALHAMQSGFNCLDVTCHHGDKFAFWRATFLSGVIVGAFIVEGLAVGAEGVDSITLDFFPPARVAGLLVHPDQ